MQRNYTPSITESLRYAFASWLGRRTGQVRTRPRHSPLLRLLGGGGGGPWRAVRRVLRFNRAMHQDDFAEYRRRSSAVVELDRAARYIGTGRVVDTDYLSDHLALVREWIERSEPPSDSRANLGQRTLFLDIGHDARLLRDLPEVPGVTRAEAGRLLEAAKVAAAARHSGPVWLPQGLHGLSLEERLAVWGVRAQPVG